jgi:hypothetical protein
VLGDEPDPADPQTVTDAVVLLGELAVSDLDNEREATLVTMA